MTASITGWRPGRGTWLVGGMVVLLATLLVTAGVTSLAWGSTLREEERLLPGTTVAGVDVGDQTVEEARAAVEAHLEPRLDRSVAVLHGDERWEVTARELGGTSDADEVLDRALERTMDAGITELTRMRWVGASIGPDLDIALGVPDEAADAFVTTIADEMDRDPTDAEVAWNGESLELTEGREGLSVDVEASVAALAAALTGDDDTVELAVDAPEPEITTAAAQTAVDTLTPLVEQALDHTVTLTHDGASWSTSPRDLGGRPDLDRVLATALEGDDPGAVEVTVPDDALGGFVSSVAGEVDIAPRNAELAVVGDEFDVTPERDGIAVDREEVAGELRGALAGGASEVELTVRPARASVTSASFDRVLVLRQDERVLQLFEAQESTREWPVAVGQGGSPTPTGMFTVGAKRFEPTWVNPSPDGWGSDMPARVGPGTDNPLGTRALNWNQQGRDTLIRFHGTPNEDSIGEAASRGCVRMFNRDVEELYDLVSSGTVIVSQR